MSHIVFSYSLRVNNGLAFFVLERSEKHQDNVHQKKQVHDLVHDNVHWTLQLFRLKRYFDWNDKRIEYCQEQNDDIPTPLFRVRILYDVLLRYFEARKQVKLGFLHLDPYQIPAILDPVLHMLFDLKLNYALIPVVISHLLRRYLVTHDFLIILQHFQVISVYYLLNL